MPILPELSSERAATALSPERRLILKVSLDPDVGSWTRCG